MFRTILAVTLLGVALASRSANQYVDTILQSSVPIVIRNSGLLATPLPSFNVRFGPQTVYGSAAADFINGNLTGLGNLRRYSECQGPRMFGSELSINCTVRLQPLVANYAVRIVNNSQVVNLRSNGHFDDILIDLSLAGRAPSYFGSVKRFQVVRMGSVTPTFAGLPQAYNRYVKVLQDNYRSYVSTQAFNMLQPKLISVLGQAFTYTPMPRQ